MEHLWAPWRLGYVTGSAASSQPAPDGPACLFCEAGSGSAEDDLVLIRGRLSFVILNRFPYNNGHLMVAPLRHVASLASATDEELAEVMRFTRDAEVALTEAYAPHGINVGINLGRPAGAGIVDHFHVHLVPRWNGDTSFMSVIGNVRVLPEELGQTVTRLRPIFEQLSR